LLTPSGRALATNWQIRNVGSTLAPCVIPWPDNEPIPERGQIKPHDTTHTLVCDLTHCLPRCCLNRSI
ncbi:hypothetical protein B0H13DRAFT_1633397, partial [Mycena leptocephala]